MKRPAIDGTDVGFPVPIHDDVWSKNVDPILPMQGALMQLLAADLGLPEMIPGVERRTQSYSSSHIVGFDLGSYTAPNAERAMIAGRATATMQQELQRVFVNPRELPA